jgi:hypothetical protein
VSRSRVGRKRLQWCLSAIVCGAFIFLGACGGSVLYSAPQVIYPDAPWAAGIEGDVLVETCNPSSSPHVVSGRPELTAAALEMAAGHWRRQPRSAGTSLENCRQTRFAFRRSPTPSEAATLAAAEDTVFVARGLKMAEYLDCPPPADHPEFETIEGTTYGDATIDEFGHVSSIELIESVGGPQERAAVGSMKACVFVPATVDGKPFVSHHRFRIRWVRP